MARSASVAASFLLLIALSPAQAPKPPGLQAETSQPFSWYLVPSDVVGFKDCPQGFQVTYDGAFNNGFGELDLQAGSPLKPVDQRVKTLYKGHYPIIEYSFVRDGARYHVESFGAPLNLDPREDLIAFIRVTISNPGKAPVSAGLSATYGKRGAFGRAEMPCRPWYRAKFMDHDKFAFDGNAVVGGGKAVQTDHLVYMYSGSPKLEARNAGVEYDFDLAPGQSESVVFRVPFVPIRAGKTAEDLKMDWAVLQMQYDDYFKRVVKFWDGIFGRAVSLQLNDPKVTDAVLANLAYDLIARDVDEDGKHFTQTVNKFQYHGFFMRDTSFIAHSYDLLNLHDVAGETVDHYLIRDASGKVVSLRHDSPDDWGQSLWAIGAHFRATGDLAFAREVHPALPAHLDDFVKAIKSDPLGLWPVAGPYDNELVNGHYTSHNLWALLGLRETENLCRAVGDKANADRAHRYYVDFRKTFVNRLALLTATDDGYIPPGMDDPLAGHDWENASGGVYPFGVFPPDHPWVTATVNMEREYKYREGIMTWGPNAWKGKVAAMKGIPFDPLFLHDYDTFQVTETLLARGEQQKVVEDLYSTLIHTSSTHAGFETSIRPWSNRDPDGNFPPHGWFAARYNELVHNMLVREDGRFVHLCSALSPEWIGPGKTLSVQRAATTSGTIGFTIHATETGATVDIDSKWRTPAQFILHFPWFVKVTSARVVAPGSRDWVASPEVLARGFVGLKSEARHVVLKWRWIQHPDLSYARAVQLWLHKAYDPNPGEDMDHLFPTPTRPGLAEPNTLFADRYELKLVSRSGRGTIHYTLDGYRPTLRSPVFRRPVMITRPTTVRAFEVWPDGRVGDELYTKLTKATYTSAVTPSQAVEPGGLAYEYYEGDIKAMPDFSSLTPTRTGIAATGNLENIQHRPEVFAIQETGYVKIPKDGIYTFWTGSDDGSKLWIDGRLVVDNDGPHAYQEMQGQVALRASLHPIRVTYFDSGGANYLRLFWQGPGFAKQHFAATALFHG